MKTSRASNARSPRDSMALVRTGCVVGAALLSAQLSAQDLPRAPGDGQAGSGGLDEVVVSGTRVRSEFTAPTPTQVIGGEELAQSGATNIYDVLVELPAFNSRMSGAAAGVRTQIPGQTFADLRGLGSPRTLVLVDGRRFVPSVPASSVGNPYQVDLNLIPSLMLERVEIVTGGASAQWGSDAVAGVVNMILKKNIEGTHVEVQSGLSGESDGRELRAGFVSGFSFNGQRGRVVLSGDYSDDEGLDNYRVRDWSDDYWQLFDDPTATVENGRPSRVMRRDAQPGNITPGGLITNASGGTAQQRAGLIGLQFDSPTSVSPFVRGEFNPATTPTTFAATQAGGNNADDASNSLVPATERAVLYGHLEHELGDSMQVFFDASWGRSTGSSVNQPIRDRAGVYNPATRSGSQVRIYADNPYIPEVLRPLIPMPAGPATSTPPGQSFILGRVAYENRQPYTEIRSSAYTGSSGVKGELGSGWTWDLTYTYGRNEYFRTSQNVRDRSLYALAADVIDNPATPGVDPICRSTLTDPTNGCVPVNLFGRGTPSEEAFNYYTGTPFARLTYYQRAGQANLQGSPFSTWAGPVAIALGAEARNESLVSTTDERTQARVWDITVGGAFSGNFTVKEGYFETTLPLATNLPAAQSLALNGAVRHADYSRFGGVTTWKAGGTWEPVDGLMFRATRSLDIRAPSLYEMDSPATTSLNNVRFNGVTPPAVQIDAIGNPALEPERSHTTTIGASFAPSFLPGLMLSADFYDIYVDGVIATVGQVEIARLCELGVQRYCELLEFNSTGALIRVYNRFLNLSSFETRGVDLTGAYNRRILGGNLNFRWNATYVDRFTIAVPRGPGEAPSINEQAGQHNLNEGATPHWKARFSTTYSRAPFSVTTQVRFVGSGQMDNDLREAPTATLPAEIDPKTNRVGSYFLFNVSGTFDVLRDGRGQLFWMVNNLFDRDPPIIPSPILLTQTNPTHYDVMGRYYKIGVRVNF